MGRGGALGALAPGFVLLPLFGVQKGIVLMACLNVSIGLFILLARWRRVAVLRFVVRRALDATKLDEKLSNQVGLEEGEVITHPMVTNAIGKAQQRVEAQNFSIRKRLLEYDDVMNKQRVAAEPGCPPGDGGRRAPEGPCDLAVGRAGLEPGGDRPHQLGALAEVGRREGPLAETRAAGPATEGLDPRAAFQAVVAVFLVAESLVRAGVFGAVASRAEWRLEVLQSIDGGARPEHAA